MKDGGQAFPTYTNVNPELSPGIVLQGMTMRQWYKGNVLGKTEINCMPLIPEETKKLAELIGQIADAMIKEDQEYLEKEKNNE